MRVWLLIGVTLCRTPHFSELARFTGGIYCCAYRNIVIEEGGKGPIDQGVS